MTTIDTSNAVDAKDAPQNPLVALVAEGQSIWLDYITRDLVRGGELKRMIEQDGLRGMTSNPTIFQKAIASGNAYDEQIDELLKQQSDPGAVFEGLAIRDIQDACDVFRPLYDETNGLDGYVSIEVSPNLAYDAKGTEEEARRLWKTVNRPNVMIKVPGTNEGAQAVKSLLRDGINVNVTLLFSLQNHERVMWAYIEALEERAAAGEPLAHIASVASFFVSRVDTLVDKLLDERIAASNDPVATEQLQALKGKAAIANAKLAYERFRNIFDTDRFVALQAKGAHVQRPLWASTGTKNPAYSDVLYIESLIGPDTVNTVPQPTLQAFIDHGQVSRTVDTDIEEAHATMKALGLAGIDYDTITKQLEDEGVKLFIGSYDELIAGVGEKQGSRKGA